MSAKAEMIMNDEVILQFNTEPKNKHATRFLLLFFHHNQMRYSVLHLIGNPSLQPEASDGFRFLTEKISRASRQDGAYWSDGSDDLNDLRSQYAHAFSMTGVQRTTGPRPSIAEAARGSGQRPVSAMQQQARQEQYRAQSGALSQSPAKQTASSRYQYPSQIPSPSKQTSDSPSRGKMSRASAHPAVAGWVETGRYGGEPSQKQDVVASEGHSVSREVVDDESFLAMAFKNLQERIHLQMSAPRVAQNLQNKAATTNPLMGQLPSTHVIETVVGQEQGTRDNASFARSRDDGLRSQEAQPVARGVAKGSPAGAASLRAGTTRRQIAQAYDEDYETIDAANAWQPPPAAEYDTFAAGEYSGLDAKASNGFERRSDRFGGDGKEWEYASSAIRTQFANMFSALTEEQFADKRPSTAPVVLKQSVHVSKGPGEKSSAAGAGTVSKRERRARDEEPVIDAGDGITTSMTDLRREIYATAQQYNSNKLNMRASYASKTLRAQQRKAAGRLIPSQEKQSRESFRRSMEDWEAEARGKSWAKKLKEMHQVVRDLEPLIDMATAKPLPKPVSSRPKTAISSGSRMPADGIERTFATQWGPDSFQDVARPKTAGGSRIRREEPASQESASTKPRFQAWGHENEWASDLGHGGEQHANQPGMSVENEGVDASLYARDEAIGARPRTRRGRGMLTRDSVAVDDQASNSHQHLMEAVPVGDDETSPNGANGVRKNRQHMASERDEGHVIPKRDEAIGARPPTRRGRPDPPRRTQNHQKGYDDGGVIDGGEAGREIFSDCTTPDAPDGIDADNDEQWKRANGIHGHMDGAAEILRLSGSEGALMTDQESDEDSDYSDYEEEENDAVDDTMWRRQEQVLKLMAER